MVWNFTAGWDETFKKLHHFGSNSRSRLAHVVLRQMRQPLKKPMHIQVVIVRGSQGGVVRFRMCSCGGVVFARWFVPWCVKFVGMEVEQFTGRTRSYAAHVGVRKSHSFVYRRKESESSLPLWVCISSCPEAAEK